MKKYILVASIILLACTNAYTQSKKYPLVIFFSSICCGTPSGEPIFNYIISFKKEHHLKTIKAISVNGLGKEGEHAYYFLLEELNTNERQILISKLIQIAGNFNQKRNTHHDGYINVGDSIDTMELKNKKNIEILEL